MKKFATTLAIVGAVAAVAPAAASAKISHGVIRSFTYNSAKKTGKLVIFNAHLGQSVYRFTKDTDCGVSYGQSGDQIPCRTFGAAKYDRKTARVQWTRAANGDRIAVIASVDMS